MSIRQSFRSLAIALGLFGALLASAPASADLCVSTTTCSLTLNQGNSSSGFGTGNFGTVTLTRVGNTVTVNVDMADGWTIVNTGFPGSFGFSDSLGGGLTIGNFSSALYSGGSSHAASDQHFDGFGYFNDAGATTGPNAPNGINQVSFDVSGAGLNDVEQLLNLANPAGGDGLAYFVVDGFNGRLTGLVAVTGGGLPPQVPEPQTLALIGLGLMSLTLMRRQFQKSRVS